MDRDINKFSHSNVEADSFLVISLVFNPFKNFQSSSQSIPSTSFSVVGEARNLDVVGEGGDSAGGSAVSVNDMESLLGGPVEQQADSFVKTSSVYIEEVNIDSFLFGRVREEDLGSNDIMELWVVSGNSGSEDWAQTD